MVQELLEKNTTNYYNEKLMMFEDFDEFLPIITPERVKTPIEATLDFFKIPKDKRNISLNFTD